MFQPFILPCWAYTSKPHQFISVTITSNFITCFVFVKTACQVCFMGVRYIPSHCIALMCYTSKSVLLTNRSLGKKQNLLLDLVQCTCTFNLHDRILFTKAEFHTVEIHQQPFGMWHHQSISICGDCFGPQCPIASGVGGKTLLGHDTD